MPAREFYDRAARAYDAETFEPGATLAGLGRRARTAKVLAMLDRRLDRPGRVLDVGCGPGQFAGPCLARGHEYLGLDISPEMFARTARRLAHETRAAFATGDVERLDLPDASADAVLCVGVVEYLERDDAALSEMRRVLRDGGVAIVTFPSARDPVERVKSALRPVLAPRLRAVAPSHGRRVWLSDITHRTIAPAAFFAAARAAGFRVVETETHGFYPLRINHRLSGPELAVYHRLERAGARLLPSAGADFIACLRA